MPEAAVPAQKPTLAEARVRSFTHRAPAAAPRQAQGYQQTGWVGLTWEQEPTTRWPLQTAAEMGVEGRCGRAHSLAVPLDLYMGLRGLGSRSGGQSWVGAGRVEARGSFSRGALAWWFAHSVGGVYVDGGRYEELKEACVPQMHGGRTPS